MGKCIPYTAAAIVFAGIGAIVAGVAVYYYVSAHSSSADEPNLQTLKAVCKLQKDLAQFQEVSGTLWLTQLTVNNPVEISGSVLGLTSGYHGFHIHEGGIVGGNCTEAGGHYNPHNTSHGFPDSKVRHVGDLGNVISNGTIYSTDIEISDKVITLWGEESIMGRSVVIHAKRDMGPAGDESGSAGARVACCTIMHSPDEN